MASFIRTLIVDIGGKRFESTVDKQSLRAAFSIERDKSRFPNSAEVAIYNLSESSRSDLQNAGEAQVNVEAGYNGQPTRVFAGVLRKVESVKDGSDWVTRLSSGDSEKEIALSHTARNFAIGTPFASVLNSLVGDLGVGRGNQAVVTADIALKKLDKATPFVGPSSDLLHTFLQSVGWSFSIQDNVLQFQKGADPVSPIPITTLTPSSGLIGSPRVDQKGLVSGRALLTTDIIPGALFTIASNNVTGAFTAKKTIHSGDSGADDWFVDFVAEPLSL